MADRPSIPKNLETEVLIKSRRRCCLCFGISGDSSEKQGQIAHLDRNRANNTPENLAFLCLFHHDRYDGRTSQSKGITTEEVKFYQNLLWQSFDSNRTLSLNESPDAEIHPQALLAMHILIRARVKWFIMLNGQIVMGEDCDPFEIKSDNFEEDIRTLVENGYLFKKLTSDGNSRYDFTHKAFAHEKEASKKH